MADYASRQETELALEILFELQSKDPNGLKGILNKYGNPFTSWPLLKEPTKAFLRFFETPDATETEIVSQKNINPKLQEMIDEFDREYAEAKENRVNASTAAQKFVASLKEQAKKANVGLSEAQSPQPQEKTGAPVSQERLEPIISTTLQQPCTPEEKELFFHALTSIASERPDKSIVELSLRANEITEAARVLTSPPPLATGDFQKNAALLQPLNILVNHPEQLPKNIMEKMVDRWGENFVNSTWFIQLRTDANRMMGAQPNPATILNRISSVVLDVKTTIFQGPIEYVELYRMAGTQGIHMADFSQYRSIVMGYGGQLARIGANYAMRAGVKAGLKKAAVGTAVKVGAEAAAGAATGWMATAVMIGADFLKGLVNKSVGFFKSLVGMGDSGAPEDKLLLVVGAGVVLVFFLPLFPLLNLPAFNQSMIDTSLATGVGLGAGIGPAGATTRSCAKTDGIYLSQGNPQWGSLPYGGSQCTIAASACGPTSVAMILNAFGFTPLATVPSVVSEVLGAGGFRGCYSTDEANVSALKSHNLRVTNIFTSCTQASNYLKACGLILAQGTSHRPADLFNPSPHDVEHYIVITGISCNGDVAVSYDTLDPAYRNGPWTQTPATFTLKTMYSVVNPAQVQ